MKHGIENLHGIRYTLCIMGVPMKGASYMYGNNMSVVTNLSKPESTLKKKLNSIFTMQYVRLLQWASPCCPHTNQDDLFTKVLYGQTWRFLVSWMLWDVFPGEDVQV
jgi:hypothetical protein